MRPAAVLLLCLLAGVSSSPAQTFRIATWQLHDLPKPLNNPSPAPSAAAAGASSSASSSAEDQRWLPVAEVLSAADADVVILYGVPDGDGARRIASQMKPRKYTVALHTGFRHNGPKGPFVGQPVAFLTRKERLAGKSIEWAHTGRIELPGGFSFATFRSGPSIVAVYVATLPGSLTNGISAADGVNMARKRNYAAQYLAHHASWLTTTYTNPVVAAYLTGDINLTPKSPLPDECAKILEQAGFRALSPGTAQDKASRSLTNWVGLDCVQDPIFTKGIEFAASRQTATTKPENLLITCDLTLKPPTSAALNPAAKNAVKLAGNVGKPVSTGPLGTAARNDSRSIPTPKPVAPLPATPAPAAPPVPAIPAPDAAAVREPELVTASGTLESRLAAFSSNAPGRSSGSGSERPTVVTEAATAAASVAPVRKSWWWLPVAGGAGLVLACVGTLRFLGRSRGPRPRLASDSVFLEMHVEEEAESNRASANAIVTAPPTATGNAQDALHRVPSRHRARSRPGASSAGPSGENVMPQLQRLMRERVVQWLSRQRTQLIDAQEQGTSQVLELQVRLERIKEQFQKRLLEQQQRIADLDTALRSKERIIKELLRARPSSSDS